jgi:(S)-sulfolactate dehydrogenase
MPQVVITEFMDSQGVAELSEAFDTLYDPSLASDTSRLTDQLAETQALVVRNKTRVNAELLDAAPDLVLVARLGVGLDNIDVAECETRRIVVAPAIGANAAAVAEYVIGALLVLFRGVYGLTDDVAAGDWPRERGVGREIMGKQLGLIGLGLIAREVARRAGTLGMELAAYDPYLPAEDEAWLDVTRMEELEEIMSSVDAVSIHVPLTDATRNLIDEPLIRSMRPGSVLVNTARGGIVEEEALARAIGDGRVGGAALDVFSKEPLDERGRSLFSGLSNVILTPHVAGITDESERRTAHMTIEAVRRALGGPG